MGTSEVQLERRICVLLPALLLVMSVHAHAAVPATPTPAPGIAWLTDYEAAVEQAQAKKAPLLIDFYADWCGPCHLMDEQVFTDPRVIKALGGWVCLKLDMDKRPDVALAYQSRSIPRTIVINLAGEIVGDHIGFVPAAEYLKFLENTRPYLDRSVGALKMPTVVKDPAAAASDEQIESMQGAAAHQLIEFLASPDPRVRDRAVALLVERKEETRPLVEATLSHAYLGARIAAWKALRQMGVKDLDYDPWAPKSQREQVLLAWREAEKQKVAVLR